MAIGSGLAAQIGFATETTAGTPVTVTDFLPLIDESLAQDRGRVESEAIIAGRRILDSAHWAGGNIMPGGDIGMELYNVGIGSILTGLLGTVSSTTGSGPYTLTWTSAGEPKPLTIQVGVPATSGTVHPKTLTGAMIESAELSCTAGEFARLGVTVAAIREFGVRTVTDGATTDEDTTITSNTASFTADDVGKPISGTGIPASTTIASVTSSTEAELSAAATATGTGVTFTIGIALASASYPSGLSPYVYHEGSVSIASSAVSVRELTLSISTGLNTDRFFLGSRYRKVPIEAGLHVIEGTLELEWEGRAQYDRYINESEVALDIVFRDAAGNSLTFDMGVRLDGSTPQVGGPDIVPHSVPFRAVGATDAAAFAVEWVSVTDTTP